MTYCTTCGAYDTLVQHYDNHCCGECGDSEGLIYLEDYEPVVQYIIKVNPTVTKKELRGYRL